MSVFAESEAMSKRQAESEPGGAEPPAKKIVFEPLQLGAINNIEELDIKTLQFQNRKLGQRLALKNKIEEELRARYCKFCFLNFLCINSSNFKNRSVREEADTG